jgi:hypothetical protein
MPIIRARLFNLPEQGEVVIESRPNGDVRVADLAEDNVQTITRAQSDEAARLVLGMNEDEPVPAHFARRLAFARLAQDAGSVDHDELVGRRCGLRAAGEAPAAQPSSASPLSQVENAEACAAGGMKIREPL